MTSWTAWLADAIAKAIGAGSVRAAGSSSTWDAGRKRGPVRALLEQTKPDVVGLSSHPLPDDVRAALLR